LWGNIEALQPIINLLKKSKLVELKIGYDLKDFPLGYAFVKNTSEGKNSKAVICTLEDAKEIYFHYFPNRNSPNPLEDLF